MPQSLGLVLVAIAVIGVLSGCGGSEVAPATPSTAHEVPASPIQGGTVTIDPISVWPISSYFGSRGLTIFPSSGFNGHVTAFRRERAFATERATSTEIVLTQGTRRLTLTLPTITPEVDDRFSVGNGTRAGEATAIYTEGDRRWRANLGTIEILGVHPERLDTKLSVSFAPDVDGTPNAAHGTLTIEGLESELPYGRDEGPGLVAFTNDPVEPTISTLTPFGPTAEDWFNDGNGVELRVLELIQTDGGTGNRGIELQLPETAAPGDTFTFGVQDRLHPAAIRYFETRGGWQDTWRGLSGSCLVVARSRSHIEVRLDGVAMTTFSSSLGRPERFQIDGVLKR